jgi:hypothetical protein
MKYIFLVKTVTNVQQITSNMHASKMKMHIRVMLILVIILDQMNLWDRDAFRMTYDQVKSSFKDMNALQ